MTMRNIIVCIKTCLDTSLPLQILEDENYISQLGVISPIYIINPSDLCALEEAMRVKNLLDAKVIAISLGSDLLVPALKYCLARGVDRAIHLYVPESILIDAQITATILADEIRRLSPILILCGDKSIDNESGLVGPMLAEYVDLPQITNATKFVLHENDNFTVHRRLERGSRQIVDCKFPALITVSIFLNHPRYVSIFRQRHIRDIEIEKIIIQTISEPSCWIQKISLPKPRPRKINAPDLTLKASDRLRFMMTGGMIKKESNIFEGPPNEAAEKIFTYLQKNGIL
jgi:electron transfer flavoprotein beta subunit